MKKMTGLTALAALAIVGCGGPAADGHAVRPSAATAAKQKVLTCSQLDPDGALAKVVTDLRMQDHLVAEMGSSLSAATLRQPDQALRLMDHRSPQSLRGA